MKAKASSNSFGSKTSQRFGKIKKLLSITCYITQYSETSLTIGCHITYLQYPTLLAYKYHTIDYIAEGGGEGYSGI